MRFVKFCFVLIGCVGAAQAQWTLQNSGSTADLRSIDNVGDGVAWASGGEGTVLRTTDECRTWTLVAANPASDWRSLGALAMMDKWTARAVSGLPGSERRNVAGVRVWTCGRKSDHRQAGRGRSLTSYIVDEQHPGPGRALAHCVLAYHPALSIP
ncbi:MAG TPA: hypothetical protein VGF88_02345 [Acidobacteriaceae bacterium]|jgi:hypothetical protein